MLCYAILYYTILCYAMLYYTILYYAMLCYAMLCYTILYYTILYYTHSLTHSLTHSFIHSFIHSYTLFKHGKNILYLWLQAIVLLYFFDLKGVKRELISGNVFERRTSTGTELFIF